MTISRAFSRRVVICGSQCSLKVCHTSNWYSFYSRLMWLSIGKIQRNVSYGSSRSLFSLLTKTRRQSDRPSFSTITREFLDSMYQAMFTIEKRLARLRWTFNITNTSSKDIEFSITVVLWTVIVSIIWFVSHSQPSRMIELTLTGNSIINICRNYIVVTWHQWTETILSMELL